MKILGKTCFVSILVSCALISMQSCASSSKEETKKSQPIRVEKPIELRLKGEAKREKSQVVSVSHTKTFLNGKIRREKVEQVDFSLSSKLVTVTNDGILSFDVTTVKKNGFVNLREMAFPELGETIRVSFSPDGKVIQAGQYPSNSIFYVPPISLPPKAVMPGDTWTMSAEWLSSSNGIPLKLNVLTIFKGLYSCDGGTCAQLEIAGNVNFVSTSMQKLDFKSQIEGLMVFHVEEGRLVSSEIHNLEILKTGETEVIVKSCLKSLAAASEIFPETQECVLRTFDREVPRGSIFGGG